MTDVSSIFAAKLGRHASAMQPNVMARLTAAGTMAIEKYAQNPIRPACPIRMFCGLPMRVATEPALLAAASCQNKNGRASSFLAAESNAQERRHCKNDDVIDQKERRACR